MWNRRTKKSNTYNLDMFLEDIESNADEMSEGGEDIKRKIIALKKQGKTDDEVIEMLASKVGAEALGQAWVELKTSGKLTENSYEDMDDEEDDGEVEEEVDTDNEEDEETDNDEDKEEVQENFEIGESEEDKKQMQEAQFSKKDYNVVVDIITNSADKIVEELKLKGKEKSIKDILAKEFADVFKADNPRFDAERFINAFNKE